MSSTSELWDSAAAYLKESYLDLQAAAQDHTVYWIIGGVVAFVAIYLRKNIIWNPRGITSPAIPARLKASHAWLKVFTGRWLAWELVIVALVAAGFAVWHYRADIGLAFGSFDPNATAAEAQEWLPTHFPEVAAGLAILIFSLFLISFFPTPGSGLRKGLRIVDGILFFFVLVYVIYLLASGLGWNDMVMAAKTTPISHWLVPFAFFAIGLLVVGSLCGKYKNIPIGLGLTAICIAIVATSLLAIAGVPFTEPKIATDTDTFVPSAPILATTTESVQVLTDRERWTIITIDTRGYPAGVALTLCWSAEGPEPEWHQDGASFEFRSPSGPQLLTARVYSVPSSSMCPKQIPI